MINNEESIIISDAAEKFLEGNPIFEACIAFFIHQDTFRTYPTFKMLLPTKLESTLKSEAKSVSSLRFQYKHNGQKKTGSIAVEFKDEAFKAL